MLSQLQKNLNKFRKQAFVAMWFDKTMDSFYQNGIKLAIEADGTKCMRIDLHEHNNKICDEIIAEIRRSNYLVADFTGNRGGVYYEAGFAYGLGIPVIWTVHQNDLASVHFDTRQYNHIVYETEEQLKERLLNRIKATIVK
ncbi:MAG: nucleoside 2-deoxyribosyltransferase [Gammaproteobacteria bacterium]|nr:MAG: nucleoside 2-deoxyribosyltransferase [Gammaproteobacteria bacterium]